MCSGQGPPPNWKHLKKVHKEPFVYYIFMKSLGNSTEIKSITVTIPLQSQISTKKRFKTYSKKETVIIAIKRKNTTLQRTIPKNSNTDLWESLYDKTTIYMGNVSIIGN